MGRYTNELNDALLLKHGNEFWKCWNSKFSGGAGQSLSTNLAALDISKASDRVDHLGLFLKLLNRRVPVVLLTTLGNWFSKCYTCVRWCSAWSSCITTSSLARRPTRQR